MEFARKEERVVPYPILGTMYRECHGYEKQRAVERLGLQTFSGLGVPVEKSQLYERVDAPEGRSEFLFLAAGRDLRRMSLEDVLDATMVASPARAYRVQSQNT